MKEGIDAYLVWLRAKGFAYPDSYRAVRTLVLKGRRVLDGHPIQVPEPTADDLLDQWLDEGGNV